jgi:hypothetical protein
MNDFNKDELVRALGEAAEEFFSEEMAQISKERDALQNMIDGIKDNLTLIHGLVVPEGSTTEEDTPSAVVETVADAVEEVEPVAEEVEAVEEAIETPAETPESLGLPTEPEPTEKPPETPESLGLTTSEESDTEEAATPEEAPVDAEEVSKSVTEEEGA